MKQIEKPITVVRQEFEEKLIREVNGCQLPLFVVEPILKDLLEAVQAAARKQYETDKARYEQQLEVQSRGKEE
jgi:hypothetical protein